MRIVVNHLLGTGGGGEIRRHSGVAVQPFQPPTHTDPAIKFTAYDVYYSTDGSYVVVDRSPYVDPDHA